MGLPFRNRSKAMSDRTTSSKPGSPECRIAVPDDGPGPRELQSTPSRSANLVFIGIFSLGWNSVVWSVILFVLLPEALKGHWVAWFPLLFLSIFVIVGLFMIVVFIDQLLALTNPRLRLIVNRHAFRPGEMLELEWECSGNSSRLTSLSIALEGRESATYCRGTDTTTEIHVFARLPLATLDDAAAILGGRTKLRLPADAVPTFIARCNKIEWILIVRGMIPRWPDISDDYSVTILPPRATP